MPCASANCGVRRYKWVYGNVFANPYYSGGSWALVSDCNASGDDYICSPSNSTPPGPILGSCGGAFAAYHTWLCSEFGEIPGVDCQEVPGTDITGTGIGCFDVACTCVDSGNCGESNCGPTETCCYGTTCVATDSFQTDNNNCGGCGTVCEAGYICVDGECVIDCAANSCTWTWTGGGEICFVCDQPNNSATPCINGSTCPEGYTLGAFPEEYTNSGGDVYCTQHTGAVFYVPCVSLEGCCTHWHCLFVGPYSSSAPFSLSEADCAAGGPGQADPSIPCDALMVENHSQYNTWVAGPCDGGGGGGGGGAGSWALTTACPQDCACSAEMPDRPGAFDGETVSYPCNGDCACEEGDGPPDPDPNCDSAPASVTKQPEMMPNLGPSIADGPCSQEECEAHVSTWMAEASGKPNEEGLYKVKWILLDGCPGACCSDQPTQPEFVKKSTLVDAPCKCGCS